MSWKRLASSANASPWHTKTLLANDIGSARGRERRATRSGRPPGSLHGSVLYESPCAASSDASDRGGAAARGRREGGLCSARAGGRGRGPAVGVGPASPPP